MVRQSLPIFKDGVTLGALEDEGFPMLGSQVVPQSTERLVRLVAFHAEVLALFSTVTRLGYQICKVCQIYGGFQDAHEVLSL